MAQWPQPPITQHPAPAEAGALFSILIPSWNNLAYLQCCVESLRRHSTHPHQLIVHVNEGSDGTLEWVRAQGIAHTHSQENAGVCHSLNAAAKLATTDFVAFFNDDMVALPGWDEQLMASIRKLDKPNWFLSSTMIEPKATGNACVIVGDYGSSPSDFREADLLREFASLPKTDWSGATWPPNVVPRQLWEAVGGYSTEFSPGLGSDPDFSMKLWQHGVRHFQGVAASRVYHFQARSTGRVQRNDGSKEFLAKWGITIRTFAKHYLHRGEHFTGPLNDPSGLGWQWDRLRSKLKSR
jgi:glycosyltransferase involved in cell wall biosynthesis